MREQLKFGQIQTPEALASLAAFAKTFDHHVGPDTAQPIFTIESGQRLIGFFNLILYPIVCPAFHPEIITPRNVYDALHAIKTHFCMGSISERFKNGICLMSLHKDMSKEQQTFASKVGFKNTHKELWQATP